MKYLLLLPILLSSCYTTFVVKDVRFSKEYELYTYTIVIKKLPRGIIDTIRTDADFFKGDTLKIRNL